MNQLFERLNAKLRAYYNYYGINGNYASLNIFYYQVIKLLRKQLDQRSQRKSYNWTGFNQLTEQFGIEKPRIVSRLKTRMASHVA